MPMWSPPTPPHDDNDRYIDQSMFFLYEPNIMPETQLPPVYIKKEHKKPKIESITTRKQKQRKEEQTRVPRSLFDRPSAQLLKMRREHKLKSGLLKPFRPVPPIVKQPTMDHSADHPEWLIHEDWALLQAVQSLFDVPLNLMVVSPAHHPNWDLVADVVNTCSRVYRSAKQCKLRYEGVIIPREEGRILYDISPRKQSKKTKGIYKTKNNRPMRTSQLYLQDNNQAVTMLYSLRFDSSKAIAGKRPPPMKQTLVNPTLKNPKHVTVLSDNNINYDQPLQPMAVAEIRAQRIQREKKQSQAAAQATAEQQLASQRTQAQQQAATAQQATSTQQTQQTTVSAAVTATVTGQTVTQVAQTQLQPIQTAVSSAVLTGVVQKAAVGQAVSAVTLPRTAVGTGNIVVNTQGTLQTAANFAAINRRMSQATATSITQPASTVTAALNPAIRAQRTTPQALTIQEITAIATQAPTQVAQLSTAQVARPQLQTTVTAAQLAAAQRITGTTTAGTVQQLKGFPQQVLPLKQQQQQNLLAQQKIQQQQLKMQKLNLTHQQLKQLQQQNRGTPKTVIAQQLVTSLGQKQAQLKTGQLQRQLTQEEVIKLKQQQLAQKAQLTATQILPQVQHIAQTGTVASGTQLVKTVSAPAGTVPIPVSTVNINVSVPPKTIAKPIVSQLQVQQVPQAKFQHFQQIQRGQLPKPQQKITSISQPVQKSQSIPLNAVQIIQQPGATGSNRHHLTYQLQQIMQQNKPASMIITSQPTIIATVTQSQQHTGQMLTKVIGTSAAPTTQIQTIAATPVTVSHVTSVAAPTPQTSIATLSVAATGQVSKSVTVSTVTQDPGAPTTIQVQPVVTAVPHHIVQQSTGQVVQQQVSQQVVQQPKTTTLTQTSSITQPYQQVQVTPGTVQQTTNTAQPVTTLSSVTVTVTPASQTSSAAATLIQQPLVTSPTSQNVVQVSTVTSQAALAAAAALPQATTPTLTAVVQSPQQQQVAKPAAPYAMRTRNPPKH